MARTPYILWILIAVDIFIHMPTVSGDMVSHPRNVAATLGQTVNMSCTTDLSEPITIYRKEPNSASPDRMYNSIGILAERFKARMSVNRVMKEGMQSFTLTIHNVTFQDAGLYQFIDQAGQGKATTAELVVLNGPLKCEAPLLNDFVIPTDIESKPGPDVIEISCSLNYRGNLAPMLQLRHSGISGLTGVLTNFVADTVFNNQTLYTLKTAVDASLNGTRYTCNVAMPESKNFLELHGIEKWTSPELRIHNLEALEVDHNGIGQTCPFDTTVDRNNCRSQHAYIMTDMIAAVQYFKYICTTLCTVRDTTCSVSAPPVESLTLKDIGATFPQQTEQTPSECAWQIAVACVVTMVVTLLAVALVVLLRKKFHSTSDKKKTGSEASLDERSGQSMIESIPSIDI